MRKHEKEIDIREFMPAPEEAIEIANKRLTVAEASAACDVVFAFKKLFPDRTFLPIPGMDYGTSDQQIEIIRLFGTIWTSGYITGVRREKASKEAVSAARERR